MTRASALAAAAVLLLTWAQPARAAPPPVRFTISVDAANVRDGPGLDHAVLSIAYAGQSYALLAVSGDGEWLRTPQGWIFARLGDADGELAGLPITSEPVAASSAPAPIATEAARPPTDARPAAGGQPLGLPQYSSGHRALWQAAVARGHNPRMFTIAGDSNSEHLQFQERVILGWHGLANFPRLDAIMARWQPSVERDLLATRGGFGAWTLVQTPNAPPCASGESRFACDLRVSNASVVFIQLGTGDKFAWREFEPNMRAMIEQALRSAVLPVLVTKADDIEALQGGAPSGHMNSVIRRLAAEYDVPLLDFWLATRALPTVPNPDLPTRPFTQTGLVDEWGYYFHLSDEAKSLRVLMTLLALDSL